MLADTDFKALKMAIKRNNLAAAVFGGNGMLNRHPVAKTCVAVVGVNNVSVRRCVNRLAGRAGNVYAVMEVITQGRKAGVAVALG